MTIEAKTISELEEGTLSANQILKRSSVLFVENQDLYEEVEDLRYKNRILHSKLVEIGKKLNFNKSSSQRSRSVSMCARDEVKIDAVINYNEVNTLLNEYGQIKILEKEIRPGCTTEELNGRKAAFRGQHSKPMLDEKCEPRNYCCVFEDNESNDQIADYIQIQLKELRKNVNDLEMRNSELHTLNEKFGKENKKLIKQNKRLKKQLQSMGTSKVKSFDGNISVETPLGKSSNLNDDPECNKDEKLHKYHIDNPSKISDMPYHDLNENRENVCNKLKSKLEISEKELFKWVELGQLIQAKLDKRQTVQYGKEVDVEHIKQCLIPLFDEHQRLKCTENLVKQQFGENQGIRQCLSLAASKNIALNNQLSKLALRERQFHEVKRKLSKVCNEKRLLKRDVRQITKRLAQYEYYYNNYENIARGHEQFHFQYEAIHEDRLKLPYEDEMLNTKAETLQMLQDRIDHQKSDYSFSRNDQISQQLTFKDNQHEVTDND